MTDSIFPAEFSESGSLVQQLLEFAPDAIITATKQGRILFANSQAEQMFGFSAKELLGESINRLIPERFHEVHQQHELDYLADPTIRPMGRGLDLIACRKDRSEFPVDISISPLQTQSGFLICASIRDISELRKKEERIRQYANELKRSNEELTSFAHVAAHDLRGPLRRVQMICGMMQEDFKDQLNGSADELFEMIDRSVCQMQSLIKDLLDHSKVGADQSPFRPVNTSDVVKNVLSDLEGTIADEAVDVDIAVLPSVNGDRTQLQRLFQNLLGNAIAYRSDRPLRIAIDANEDDGHWEFCVSDNGIGIDAKHHQKIFEIFHRLHSEDDFPGTGIGLATCQKIVALHGGRIWVESDHGQGSTFRFTIQKRGQDSFFKKES